MTWRDIATAPRPLKAPKLDLWINDGGDGYRAIDAWWTDFGWVVAGYLGSQMKAARKATHRATHWMLPPRPPEAA